MDSNHVQIDELTVVKRNARVLSDLVVELETKNSSLVELNQVSDGNVQLLSDFVRRNQNEIAELKKENSELSNAKNDLLLEKKQQADRIHELDEELSVERKKTKPPTGGQFEGDKFAQLQAAYDKLAKEHAECGRKAPEHPRDPRIASENSMVNQQEIVNKNRRIEELEREKNRLLEQLSKAEADCKRMDKVSRTRQSDADRKVNDMKDRLKEGEKSVAKLVEERNSLRRKLDEERASVQRKLDEDRVSLQQQLREWQEKAAQYKSDFEEQVGVVGALNSQLRLSGGNARVNGGVDWPYYLFRLATVTWQEWQWDIERREKRFSKDLYNATRDMERLKTITKANAQLLKEKDDEIVAVKAKLDAVELEKLDQTAKSAAQTRSYDKKLKEYESAKEKSDKDKADRDQQIKELRSRCEKLTGELDSLKAKAAQPDPNMQKLMKENRNLKDNVKEKENMLKEKERMLSEKERMLKGVQEKYEEYENRILQMKSKRSELEMQLFLSSASKSSESRKVESSLKEKIVATNKSCSQLREQLAALRKDYDLLVETMANMTSSWQQRLNGSQTGFAATPDVSQEDSVDSALVCSLQEKIQLLEEQKLSLEKELAAVKADSKAFDEKMSVKLTAITKSLKENEQTNSSSSLMLTKYRRDLDEANEERSKLEDIAKALKQEKLQLKDERDEKRRESEKLTAERDALKKEVIDLQTETEKISTLQRNIDECDRCIEMRDAQILDLKKKLQEAVDDIEVQKTSMARLQSSSVSLKKIEAKEVELASLKQLYDDVKKEKDSVVAKLSQLQTELDQKSEAFDAVHAESQRLQTRLTCCEATTAEMQKVLEDRLKELDKFRREHHMLSAEVSRLQSQETDLRMRLAMQSSVPDSATTNKLFEEQKDQIAVMLEERNKVDCDNARLKAEIEAVKQQFQKLTADKEQAVHDKESSEKKVLSLKKYHTHLSAQFTEGKNQCVELQQQLDASQEKNRQLEIQIQTEKAEYESTLQDRDRLVEQTQLSRNSLARDSRDFYEKEIKAKEDKFNEELKACRHMNQSLMEEQKRNEVETKRMINLQTQEIQRLKEELKAANVSVEAEAERSRTLTAQVEKLKEELKVANSDVERQKKKTKNIEDRLGFANRHITDLRDEEKLAKEKAEATVALLQGELDKEKEKSKRKAGKSIDSVNEQLKVKELERQLRQKEELLRATKEELTEKSQTVVTLQNQLTKAMTDFTAQQNESMKNAAQPNSTVANDQSLANMYLTRIHVLEIDLAKVKFSARQLLAAVDRHNRERHEWQMLRPLMEGQLPNGLHLPQQ